MGAGFGRSIWGSREQENLIQDSQTLKTRWLSERFCDLSLDFAFKLEKATISKSVIVAP